jgi:hypothetical protein
VHCIAMYHVPRTQLPLKGVCRQCLDVWRLHCTQALSCVHVYNLRRYLRRLPTAYVASSKPTAYAPTDHPDKGPTVHIA